MVNFFYLKLLNVTEKLLRLIQKKMKMQSLKLYM